MKQKRKLGRKLLSFLLTLAMVIGLMPGMGLTALAYNGNPYASLVESTTTVKFNNIDWYIIADDSTAVDDGTVTLLAKDPIGGASKFHDSSNKYSSSTVKTYLDSLTATGGSFEAVADAITPVTLNIYKYNSTTEVAETIQNAKLWLLSTSEAKELTQDVRKCSQASGAENKNWWLRSPGSAAGKAACMFGWNGYLDDNGYSVTNKYGVRPALKLDLSKVTFVSVNLSGGANATVSGGSTTQAYFNCGSNRSEMTPVTYTASDGYKFPQNSAAYGTTNGITVTRTSDTVITVSGTPTAVTEITIPDAEKDSRIEQTVTAPTEATDLTYKKDQAQALLKKGAEVTTGNTATDSIQYRVGDEGTWSTEIPKGTNAGTYSVYYKVAENDEYKEYVCANPISVTIAKADPETPEAFSAIYGQKAQDIPLPTGWSWANPNIKFESSGGVELKANFAGNDNYNPKNNVSIYGTVAKAAAKISYDFTVVHKEYGSTSFTNEITNTGDVTPTYTSSYTSVATVDANGLVTIKGIGETTITANVAEDNDHYTYETRTASYKLIVNPVSTVINTAPKAADITYGQKLSESTLSGGVATVDGSEDTVDGTFAWKEPDLVPNASDSGEYEVEFTPTDTTNYAKSTCNVKVKVNKAAAPETKESLSPEQKPAAKNADDLVYTGEPIELVTAPANPLEGYKVQYSKDSGTTWTDTIPTETNVGTYTVKVKYVSDNYENIDLDDITVTITSADKTALTDAIATAKEYYDTIKGNTDYSEVADKLDEAIKAAEEVAKADKLTKAEVSTAAEAVTKAKAATEAEVKDIDDTKAAQAVIDKINGLNPAADITPADRADIEAARKAYDDLTDVQKAKLAELDSTAVSILEAAEQALDTAEKAAFDDEKEAGKKAADALAADGDSDASKKLIEDAKKAIDELAYDETKSLDENKAALAAIVSKLKDDLITQRAADKKEADDTAAAKKVTDAINALPASDKVATTDKAAIEAARKAYDVLTADQKAKVSAETLKKLEEAEKALAAAEKKAADDAKKPEGKNEWIDGQWYGADGNTEYKAKGSWKQNDKGWWYEDTDGWYPKSQWQKIDGKWYYFTADGYMDYSEYRDGYWLGSDGAWDETYSGGHWMQDSTGWWYVDATGWYPVNRYLWVDGVQYWFNTNGYWE